MRFEFDDEGYVCCILYGCTTGSCVEYTGLVPTQPEEYTDMDDWADRAQVQAYKLDASGNLVYDAERAASLPNEDDVAPYSDEQLDALGITDKINAVIKDTIFNAIYPVGSIYISANSASPATLFGGTWEQIKDKFLLSAGSSYAAGSEGGSATHSHTSPVGYNSSNKAFGISYKQGSYTTSVNGEYAATGDTVTVGSGTYSWKLPTTSSNSNLPPYLAVFVWQRTS